MQAETSGLLIILLVALSGGGTGEARAQEVVVVDSLAMEVLPPLASYDLASYDESDRRDPFVPLVGRRASAASGPRFDRLRLTGIFSGSPGNSLAVLEDPSSRGHFVRVGGEIGNARLIEIRDDTAVFEVAEYGAVRRAVLHLERDLRRSGRSLLDEAAPRAVSPRAVSPEPAAEDAQ